YRSRISVRTLAGHGIEGIGERDDAHRHGHLVADETIGVSRAIGSFMMPAHDFGDTWPGELHIAHDLVADYGVLSHLAELPRIKCAGFAEDVLIYDYLANVVQVSG